MTFKKGYVPSQATRKKWIEQRTGRIQSTETRKKKSESMKGKHAKSKNPMWKGGKWTDKKGYVYIYSPNHPYKNIDGYVFEHRLVMEAHLGRTLLPSEVVHHIDGDPSNNELTNLMLFDSGGKHTKYHWELRRGDKQ